MKKRIALLMFYSMVFFTTPALCFDQNQFYTLEDEVNRLKKDLRDLERQTYDNNKSSGFSFFGKSKNNDKASATAHSIQLEEQMRILNGKIEELDFTIRKTSNRLEKAITEFDSRLLKLENQQQNTTSSIDEGTILSSDSITNIKSQETDSNLPPIDLAANNDSTNINNEIITSQDITSMSPPAENLYEKSLALIRKDKYAEAERTLLLFIDKNPGHSLLGNAYYWLGETFYVRHDYKNAAINFLKGFNDFPQSNKASDNLYKLGKSLQGLKQNEQACATFTKIINEHPKTNENLLKKVKEEIANNKC